MMRGIFNKISLRGVSEIQRMQLENNILLSNISWHVVPLLYLNPNKFKTVSLSQ